MHALALVGNAANLSAAVQQHVQTHALALALSKQAHEITCAHALQQANSRMQAQQQVQARQTANVLARSEAKVQAHTKKRRGLRPPPQEVTPLVRVDLIGFQQEVWR
jgi:hypothetical protein